eukprot:CAMPEP_0183293290 /NCGR_PEP_ID=MMETSP0160_2-20130417/2028_1 /TAXON_ID=2839 ORGANISM="Odontella Sinensis, Strain Grunow 1884" /NCGR_SAMPLE_ID=MMETSP0160_2 /ASSEMBLY_ACC=CAM_ASM_000250 /LENGTH=211 /DNA_ID=CAMNT_0025454377 /DNA_START=329 /DNA_END=961 /DNA_ORIENTATION=-
MARRQFAASTTMLPPLLLLFASAVVTAAAAAAFSSVVPLRAPFRSAPDRTRTRAFERTRQPGGGPGAVLARTASSAASASTATATATATALSMAAKSGAPVIDSSESFDSKVLLNPPPPAGSDSDSDSDSDASTSRPIMVFYSAPWCGPCRLSNPVFASVFKRFAKDVDAYEVCTDDLPDVASRAGVVSIPTIQIYFRGELMDTVVGCVAE